MGCKLVRMAEQYIQCYFSIGRIVLSAAGNKGFSVLGECRGMYRKEHDEFITLQRRDDWPLGKFKTDRNRTATKPITQ